MRMTIPALLAVLTLSVTMACGSSSDIKTPANQSYRFEGLTTVVTWEASREATHYIVYYDDFFGDNCRVDSRGAPSFCEQLAGNVVGTSYTHPSPGRENYYWVAACNSSGCSEIDDSNPARLSGPPMPEGLVCDRAGPVQGSPSEPAVGSSWEGAVVRFNWAPSPGPRPTHYNIYYEVQSHGGWYGCMYPLAENVTETTFTLQDQVKPVPDAPWGVRVTGRTSESLTIEWEPPLSQESYEIIVCGFGLQQRWMLRRLLPQGACRYPPRHSALYAAPQFQGRTRRPAVRPQWKYLSAASTAMSDCCQAPCTPTRCKPAMKSAVPRPRKRLG